MSEPLQTPQGTQTQEQVQPDKPEDLSETEKLHSEAQQRIEDEAKEILEPGQVPPDPPKQPEQPQQPAPQEPQSPAQPQTDYQEKFRQSAREVPVILEREKQAKARIEQLTNINITEDELRVLHPDWDSMNEVEKRAFREIALANKRATQAQNLAFDLFEEQQWEKDFARIVSANPQLRGRAAEFKEYCYKPAHKNVAIDVLVKSFLFEFAGAPPEAPVQLRQGLEKGSGGPRQTGDDELTDEQLAQIRVSDPKRYRQILMNEAKRETKRK